MFKLIQRKERMFRLLRFYSVTSFLAILATALLLGLVYRQLAIHGLNHLAEGSNLTLARTVLNSVRPQLLDYLTSVADPSFVNVRHRSPSPELAEAIKTLMRDSPVVRVKIYNQYGVVTFSTMTRQIGKNQHDNPGFIAAMNGHVASALIYRDTFNSFDLETEEDNLMQTYIPVRASPIEPVQGVFEIYTDVNGLVRQNERTGFIILSSALPILMALWAALLLIVRRARNIIESQHQTILERTETLKILSARMLKSEESNKRRIAIELHEGLAQTLSAIKLNLESGRKQDSGDAGQSMEAIIPALQSAIEDVRTIATELRPSSIDDLGLLPTIGSLGRNFQQQHPGIRIREAFSVQEKDIPASLKVILYRIIMLALDDIALHTTSDQVLISLGRDDETLTLMIDDTPPDTGEAAATTLVEIDPHSESRFIKMLELATLSGGSFSAARPCAGRIMLRAAWHSGPAVAVA